MHTQAGFDIHSDPLTTRVDCAGDQFEPKLDRTRRRKDAANDLLISATLIDRFNLRYEFLDDFSLCPLRQFGVDYLKILDGSEGITAFSILTWF